MTMIFPKKPKSTKPDFSDPEVEAAVEAAEEWWIRESRRNPLAFGEYVFGLKPEKHHVRWVKQFFDKDLGTKTIVIAPRGSAKTTWLLICMLWFLSHHPWLSNMILSVTARQSQDRLAFLTDAIGNNERYARVFPHIVPDTRRSWTKTQFTVKDNRYRYSKWRSLVTRHGDAKSPTCFAAGVGGSGVIGSRVNGVLALDDLLDEKSARTEIMRDQVWHWLTTTVMPILTGSQARVWHVTTRWADTDVAARQIATKQYSYSYTKALERGPTGELRSYWPSMYPLSKLLEVLREVGTTTFNLMYMNVVTGLSGEVFSADMLRNPLPDPLPIMEEIYISCDLAIKVSESADESVVATIGVSRDPEGWPTLLVIDMVAGKWKPATTTRKIERAYAKAQRRFGTNPICLVETVAAQKIFLTLIEQGGSIPMHMVREYQPTVDKALRARPVAAIGEDQRLFFDIPQREKYKSHDEYMTHWYHKTFSQLIEFTGEKGNPDDRVDVITQVGQFVSGDVRARVVTKASVKVVNLEAEIRKRIAEDREKTGATGDARRLRRTV